MIKLTDCPNRIVRAALVPLGGLALIICSCVERTVTINTEPQGATVVLNDQEVGQSPVRVPFTWYGDYDIIIRKDGHKTLSTHHRLNAPWYQWPLIDLVSECLVPFTIRDDQVIDTFVLEPAEVPTKDDLLRRSEELRTRAIQDAPVVD
ncbi:MAG: PEGA domain-containing protein [Phycisphaerae bacterium]|nr:PEGA domain-containing protein [Phycisphaerae bacterium]